MENLVTISDFQGQYLLANDDQTVTQRLIPFIQDKQFQILIWLMGAYMYRDFEKDLNDTIVPTQQKYTDLLNGQTEPYLNFNGNWEIYQGLKEILIRLIYGAFILETEYLHTNSGTNRRENKNSTAINELQLRKRAYRAWNEGVEKYRAAYRWMFKNKDLFPEFITYHQPIFPKGLNQKQNIM